MASNKARHQKSLSDEGSIVFPVPTSNPSDVFPPDFKQPSDLVVDPYGNFYCFVCQVSVPKGDSNVSQHLTGKKHDTHNRRFASEQRKDEVRQRVLQAALQQRVARGVPLFTADAAASPANNASSVQTPLAPAVPIPVQRTSPVSADIHQASPTPAPPPSTPTPTPTEQSTHSASTNGTRGVQQKTRKAKRLAEAKRLRAIQIDKEAFLSEILADDDESASKPESSDAELHDTNAFDLSQRQKPFGPLDFKPPGGPDYFFESMAEETSLSLGAAKVRESLAEKDKILATDREDAPERLKPLMMESDAGQFLSFGGIEKDQAELEEEQERAKARERARESLIILKDESGEELPPWLLDPEATEKVLYSSDSSVSLHYEILEFSRFVSPTQAELDSRNELIMTVESIVKQLWRSTTVEIFGSYATGLYLPSSDVDICVMGTPAGGDLKEFEQLAEAIRNVTGFARRVHVIKAKVNLVKIISRKTSMNCDISIGVPNGPKYVPVIKDYVQSFPALRPLLLVIKCFLQQRDLSEVYSGGLGSYSVLLLVVSHLQMLKYNFQSAKANLGSLLQLFFQLYGRMHNLCLAGIQVKDNGCYYDKFERYQTAPQEVLRISIEDPNDVTNELGRSGYAASRVRRAFANASKTLVNWRRDHSSVPPTPLSAILQTDERFQFRRTSVIGDLEKKGKVSLRESLDPLNKRLGSSQIASQTLQEQRTFTGISSADTGRTVQSGRAVPKRHTSPDQRRERDPRLAKRRRTAGEDERNRNATQPQASFYDSGNVPRIANNSQAGTDGGDSAYPSVPNVSGNAMSNRTMRYSGHNDFSRQAYSPATPGYQYVGNPMFMGNGMGATFRTQNFMQMPQPIVPQSAIGSGRDMSNQGMSNSQEMSHGRGQYVRNYDTGGMNRGRGRPMKRGYRPRRGNHRDR